jgi:hypothetical protein
VSLLTPHPLEFAHDGFTFRQVAREGMVALYEKSRSPESVKRFELVELQVLPAQKLFGKEYPARESYPRSEQWGEHGWTYLDLASAQEAMRLLLGAPPKASNSSLGIGCGASETLQRVNIAEARGERSYRRHLTE